MHHEKGAAHTHTHAQKKKKRARAHIHAHLHDEERRGRVLPQDGGVSYQSDEGVEDLGLRVGVTLDQACVVDEGDGQSGRIKAADLYTAIIY